MTIAQHRRLPLLALAALAALAGALAALLPASTDAQSLGTTVFPFIRPGAETGNLSTNVRYWNADAKNTTTMGDYISNTTGAVNDWATIDARPAWGTAYASWSIRVQSETGDNGAEIPGTALTSPTPGWTPTGTWPQLNSLNVRATVEFTVPAAHNGPVYLRFSITSGSNTRSVETKFLDSRGPRPLFATLRDAADGDQLEPCQAEFEVWSENAVNIRNFLAMREELEEDEFVWQVRQAPRTWRYWKDDLPDQTARQVADSRFRSFSISKDAVVFVGSQAGTECLNLAQDGLRGMTTWVLNGATEFPSTAPDDGALVKFSQLAEANALVLTVRTTPTVHGAILHEDLCPRAARHKHPLNATAIVTTPGCTISRDALMRYQGATSLDDPVQRLDFAYASDVLNPIFTDITATWNVVSPWDPAGPGRPKTLKLAHFPPADPALAAFLDWTDAGREYATAKPAALFAVGPVGNAVPKTAVPSGLSWFNFDDLAEDKAVELTINRGTIAYGAAKCDKAADGSCTIALSREQLRAGTEAMADDEATGNLRVEYAFPLTEESASRITDPAVLGIKAWPDGETDPLTANLQLNGGSDIDRINAYITIPLDSDALLAPGQTAALSAGFTAAIDADGAGWGCAGFGSSFIELTGLQTGLADCILARSTADPPDAPTADANPALSSDSYLAIIGPATFKANGAKNLPLDGVWSNLRCTPASSQRITGAGQRDIACRVADADGKRPEIVVDADADQDIRIIASIGAPEDRTLRLFTGPGSESPPEDRYAEASVVELPGSFFGSATLRVGSVKDLAAISLARVPAADGNIPAGPIRIGSAADIRLAITDENGAAARIDAISSIALSVSGGGTLTGFGCSKSVSCSITTESGPLATAADANANATSRIDLTYEAPAKAGTGTIIAAVVAADGESYTGALNLETSGNAAEISLAQTLLRVNAYNTPDADVETDPDADPPVAAVKKDDRDVIKIAVSATDSRGQTAPIPPNAPTVTDPDGNTVAAGISASIPNDECNPGRTACNIVIDVNAPAATPLKSGVYKVAIGSGDRKAETEFGVAGDPASDGIAVELEDPGDIGTSFSAQITITDAEGQPVADGTTVAIAVQRRGRAAPAIQRVSPATTTTRNGRASADFVVIAREIGLINISAANASTIAIADTRQARPPAAADQTPAQQLGTAETNTYTSWPSATSTTAAALLEDLEDADAIFFWNGIRWLRYAQADGRPIPNSTDFPIQPNSILYIATSQ